MGAVDDKEFAQFLKRIKASANTPRDIFLSYPLESDNFKDAYMNLENGAEMWARLYCLDQFTVWNHVAKELEVIKKKIINGFIDEPIPLLRGVDKLAHKKAKK